MVGSVKNQILAHDRKANETEITTGFGLRWADLEASQSRTKVSILIVNGGDSKKKKSSIKQIPQEGRGSTNTGPDILVAE
jgi:hypothetical protein